MAFLCLFVGMVAIWLIYEWCDCADTTDDYEDDPFIKVD